MSQKQSRLRQAAAGIIFAAVSLLVLLSPVRPVLAQDASGCLLLGRVDAASFPEIKIYFNACDASGRFLEGLTPAGVTVLEDDQPVPLQELAVLQPGMETVLAFNFSPEFNRIISGAPEPFQTLVQALADWYDLQPGGNGDSFSLAANTGLQVIRSESGAEMAAALRALQPDFERSEASMISLTQALDLASDPENDPLKKKFILYITALPAEQNRPALTNLTERAAQAGVRVQVWLVGPPRAADTPIGQQLAELAFQTGGNLFTFSGSETLPALENYLSPLRSIYALRYQSRAAVSGAHQVSLSVQLPGGATVNSAPSSYTVQVQAPNPIFLSPPMNVDRTWQNGADRIPALSPAVLPLKILIEFPDGHPRALKKTELWVDGLPVFTRSAAPFDVLEWPLDAVVESGQHMLQVRVEDELGFTAASIEMPVDVRVQIQPRQGLLASGSTRRLVIAIVLLVTAGVLAAILLLAGRRGWRPLQFRRMERLWKDPVSQPVIEKKKVTSPVTTLPRAAYGVAVSAVLVTLDVDGNPDHERVIEISRTEMTFGRDGRRVVCLLEDASISNLHARLLCTPDGRYNLTDCGSTSGTWVNYELTPSEGFDLNHGDRVSFGRMTFRFELAEPAVPAQPVIEPYQEGVL